MSNPDLVKNIMRGAYRFLPHVLEGVDVSKVRQISIKGYNSPSLPIYNYVSPEEISYFQKYRKIIADKAQAGAEAHKWFYVFITLIWAYKYQEWSGRVIP